MDKVIDEILSNFKSKDGTEIDTVRKIGKKYVISLSRKGSPCIDILYVYENGKFGLYSPYKEMQKFLSADVVYRRKK